MMDSFWSLFWPSYDQSKW